MPTANERLFDLALRHQIDLRRFTATEIRRILRLLEQVDADITARLRSVLGPMANGNVTGLTANQQQRIQAVINDVVAIRSAAFQELFGTHQQVLLDLATIEATQELRSISDSIPLTLQLSGVEANTLSAVVTARPFQGRLLRDWFSELESGDRSRLSQAIRLGLSQGENLDTMVRRITGTRSAQYADGILAISRRNAEAIARTAVNYVSNATREAVWDANSDIILALRWTSTLDGRTTAICRARDGDMVAIGENDLPSNAPKLSPPGARPPAHINCRSTMVPVLAGDEIVGERAFVRDTRTRREQEADFRQQARDRAGGRWSDMTADERNAAIRRERREWASANIGRVPDKVTYEEWLRRQPAAFQDEVLGVQKGALFRRGGLTLDQYVDRAGNELTLDQLRDRYPSAFDLAGLGGG